MEKDNKQLLIRDICARLPYGVYVKFKQYNEPLYLSIEDKLAIYNGGELINDLQYLYLRPMSSMTDEEKEELKSKCTHTETEEDWEGVRCDVWGIQILDKYDTRRWDNPIWPSLINMDAIDWLNDHHFDYRGLIEKGLALEAPKGIYNTKK